MDCPRCGYDQSGVVASWTDECPMAGVCSECGLEFEWGDVLNRSRVLLPWLYEHRRGFSFINAPRTMIRAIRPWKFWRELQLHHAPVLRRLLLYPIVLPILFFLLSVGAVSFVFRLNWNIVASHFNWGGSVSVERYISIALFQFGMAYDTYVGFSFGSASGRPVYVIVAMLGFSLGMSVVIFIAKSSRKISKMRSIHVVRAIVYGMTLGMVLYPVHATVWALEAIDHHSNRNFYWLRSRRSSSWAEFLEFLQRWLLSDWVVPVVAMAWISTWWWFAFRDGFQLASWRAVYLAGLCTGLLIAAICLVQLGDWDWFYY